MWLIQISVAGATGTGESPGGCLLDLKPEPSMGKPEQNSKEQGAGESQGGAYPNPHDGKDEDGAFEGFLGHGGQSDIAYEGLEIPNATNEKQGEEE